MDSTLLFTGAKLRQKLSDLNVEIIKRRDEFTAPTLSMQDNHVRQDVDVQYAREVDQNLHEKAVEVMPFVQVYISQ